MMVGPVRVLLAVVAAVAVAAGELAAGGSEVSTRVLDAVAGVSFLAVAVAAAGRSNRYAVLAAIAGLAWFAGGVSELALWIHRPLLLCCALAYPTGRLHGSLARAVVAGAWVAAIVQPVARDPGASLLLGAGVAVAGWRLVATAPLGRHATARTAARAAGVLAASLALPATVRLFWPQVAAGQFMIDLYAGAVSLAGLILLGSLLTRPEGRDTDVVIELTREDDPEQTLAALRRELTARKDPASRNALTAAVDLLESNVALQADLADKVDQVRASRRRLVETAVVERQRLEQRLADGAVRYLDELADTLRDLCDTDDQPLRELAGGCLEEAERTLADLGQLARGLHPRSLVDHGLSVALAELAERSPVPTEVRAPDTRFPMIVEATVWYACAEALANLAKHAGARSAAVEVSVEGADLVACIRDDGVGGATAPPAGGLAGLADRLGAVGGELAVASPPGEGTRVRVRVPLP